MTILIHGTDTYRMSELVRELETACQQQHGTLLPLRVSADRAAELNDFLRTPSLLGEHRFAVLAQATQAEGLAELLAETDDSATVVLTAATPTTKQGKAALASLQSIADEVHVCAPLSGRALEDWAMAFCAARGSKLGRPEAARVIARVGTQEDSGALAHELAKLCDYASGEAIDAAAIDTLVPLRPEEAVWAFSNAIQEHDRRGALRHLAERLAQGVEPHLLIGMAAAAVRTVRLVRAGAGAAAGLSPWVMRRTQATAQNHDDGRLAATHQALADLDRFSKDGRIDPVDGLYAVVLDL